MVVGFKSELRGSGLKFPITSDIAFQKKKGGKKREFDLQLCFLKCRVHALAERKYEEKFWKNT